MIRKEVWSLYRTSSGVRLCWELEEPKGPEGRARDAGLLPGRRMALIRLFRGRPHLERLWQVTSRGGPGEPGSLGGEWLASPDLSGGEQRLAFVGRGPSVLVHTVTRSAT